MSRIGKPTERESADSWSSEAGGRWKWGVAADGYQISFGGVIKIVWN